MDIENGRYEIKFVTGLANYFNILDWLKLHRGCFYSPFPDRHINNIYFDKFNYFAYAENLSGTSQRNKVRYRWYGDNEFPTAGQLEVKRRRNYFGWKESFDVYDHPDYSKVKNSMELFTRHLHTQLGAKGRFWLENNPHPAILNRYKRKYFVSNDSEIRVTVDKDLRVFDQRYGGEINISNRANIAETVIIEFKCSRENGQKLSRYIQEIPIRVSRNSKYVNAMRAIHGF